MKLHVKAKDQVIVIAGKDKGKKGSVVTAFPKTGKVIVEGVKTGKVQKAFPSEGKVIVEGVAIVKRHQKPRGQGMPGGIVSKEAAIDASRVMLVCPSCGKPTRLAHKLLEDGSKVRLCKKCGETF